MLFEDFAHDLLGFFVGDLLCLLKEKICPSLIGNVELISKSIADFLSEELGRGEVRRIKDGGMELTSGSPEPPFSTDSLLAFFSLKDMLCFVTWGAPSGYNSAG